MTAGEDFQSKITNQKSKISVVPATLEHAAYIASRMRKADMEEVAVSSGRGPFTALRESLKSSAQAFTGMVEDVPVCMFGVGVLDILGGVGSPWLLGTDLVEKNAMAFLRRSKVYVRQMTDTFPYLYNYVDARNTLSIKWLKWLGFEMADEPVPYGIWGMPFYYFELRRGS
jgi:hypothetical protein